MLTYRLSETFAAGSKYCLDRSAALAYNTPVIGDSIFAAIGALVSNHCNAKVVIDREKPFTPNDPGRIRSFEPVP